MRIVAIADTHLGYLSGRTKIARDAIKQSFFDQFSYAIDTAIIKKADFLIHAGDVFNRSNPPEWAKDQFYSEIERALNHDIGVLLVPGNHDRGQLDNSLLEFYYPKFHLFNKYDIIDVCGVNIAGFPYQYSGLKSLWLKIRQQTKIRSSPTIVICHQLFRGATFGPHQFIFDKHEGVLSINGFSPNVQVITGHVHRAQQLSSGQVAYTGSTARTSFVEVIEPKGYLLVDVEYDYLKISFHEIPSLPMQVVELPYSVVMDNGVEDYFQKNLVRQLLRITHQPLKTDEIKYLYKKFDAENYPLLSISPRTPKSCLFPLYGPYNHTFDFQKIERNY